MSSGSTVLCMIQYVLLHEEEKEDSFFVCREKRVKLVQDVRARIPFCIHKFSVVFFGAVVQQEFLNDTTNALGF